MRPMSRRKTDPLQSELRRLLRGHEDIASMELLVADMHGFLKGKRIQAEDIAKVSKNGFAMCAGVVLLDGLGYTVPGFPYTETDGDPDMGCRLVPGSMAPVPWSERPMAQAMFRYYEDDGTPFFADPRTVLERALEPLYRKRLKVVMATELEFYLLDAEADTPTPGAPRVPALGVPQPGAQVYSHDDLWEVEAFLNDVYAWCEMQGIPAESAISEYAQGQFEVNLRHVDDPVLACDHAVLLKRVIKAAARKHGFVACFMAKPFEEESGCGLHVHMSLFDKDGVNYFSQGKEKMTSPPFSARLRHAIGGLLATMSEATAIFAPNANSYRRLRPEMFAPVEPNWGINHRAVAVRVPMSDQKNLRFEHRVAGADANPYLVTAAIAAGVHHGLAQRCDPGRMVEQGEVVQLKTRIPVRWDAALDKFSRSKVLPNYLGKEYCKFFLGNRRADAASFHNTVSPLDYEWYLRSV
jgi:glutamine synthetase